MCSCMLIRPCKPELTVHCGACSNMLTAFQDTYKSGACRPKDHGGVVTSILNTSLVGRGGRNFRSMQDSSPSAAKLEVHEAQDQAQHYVHAQPDPVQANIARHVQEVAPHQVIGLQEPSRPLLSKAQIVDEETIICMLFHVEFHQDDEISHT